MKQFVAVSQDNLWFGKREPSVQIQILKILSQRFFISKIELANETNTKLSNIENIVKDMMTPKNSKDSLIQEFGIKKSEGRKEQKVYGLTRYGIEVLLKHHWSDNIGNKKSGVANKPYLDVEEFRSFMHVYGSIHLSPKLKPNAELGKEYKIKIDENWKSPTFHDLCDPIDIYTSVNPELRDEYWNRIFENISENRNQDKFKKLEDAKKRLKKAKNELIETMHKKLENLRDPSDIKMASDLQSIMNH